MASSLKPPKVFISYAWEDDPHSTWVKELAVRLRTKDGLDVTLDRWDAHPGDELTLFMEKGVRDSQFVLLICTSLYKSKFDERLGGVGYEARNIAAEIQNGLAKRKIIPIYRRGEWAKVAPSAVLGDFHIDLTGDPFKETAYRLLVDTLHGRREVAPAIGHGDTLFEGPGEVPARPVANFSGRDKEMATLLENLRAADKTAVCVVAAGIGGVGKSSLARQLVATHGTDLFPEGAAWLDGAYLVSELARVCRRFGWPDQLDPTPQQAKVFLGNHLHDRSVLLVVDNLSTDVESTHLPIPGGKSRTLVTSRSVSLAQDLAVPAVTIRLEHWPADVARKYLCETVPRLASEPDTDLDALGRFVQGLPLAVRLIARALAKNVSRSPRQHLLRLKGAPIDTLDSFASTGDRGVAATFLEAYQSLSADQQAVLRALAACAQGTRVEIVAAVAGRDIASVENALNALADVSLAEYRDELEQPWRLHDVLRLFVSAQSGSRQAETAQLDWVREHLRQHSDVLAHEARDTGIAESVTAFERLLRSRGHSQASEVLSPIYQHLLRRGRYALAVELAERLLESLGSEKSPTAAQWLGNLGLGYRTLGEIQRAIDVFQRSRATYEEMGDIEGQANQLGNLGICYRSRGMIPAAVDFHERSLALNENLRKLEGQAIQLGNLGICYSMLGEIPAAIDFHERSLALSEELRNLEGQADQLGNLGICYRRQGEILTAIDFLERSLAIDKKIGLVEGQANQLGNLGNCYHELGDIPKAIELLRLSLALNEKMGRLEGQANQLGNLGNCYASLGDISTAISFYQHSLELNKKLGSMEEQAKQLANLGNSYRRLGDTPKAITAFQNSIELFRAKGLPDDHATIARLQKILLAIGNPNG